MAPSTPSRRTLQSELRSVLATVRCLSEYADEQGDTQCASILYNAAALLEATVLPRLAHGRTESHNIAV